MFVLLYFLEVCFDDFYMFIDFYIFFFFDKNLYEGMYIVVNFLRFD